MSDTPRTDAAVMEYQKLDYGDCVDAIAMRLMERELAAEKLKRQQAEHERDSILEDLAGALALLHEATAHLEWIGYGDSYERASAYEDRLPQRLDAFLTIHGEQQP